MEEMLDEQDIKRGVDFSARMGSKIAGHLEEKFSWWGGTNFSNITLIFLILVFFINLMLVYPIFNQNISSSFSSSAILTLAYISGQLNFLSAESFLLFLTTISLLIIPINIYLFIRKNSGHDLTAFLATLLFILPNPFLKEGMPLIRTLFSGDGAHVVAFTFVPLILLLVQAFISEGISVYGIIAAILTAGVAIISPFTAFNLVALFGLLTITEGFLGHIRIKIARLGFLISSSIALASFWYFPNVFYKIMALDHVEISLNRIMTSLPVVIPAIPIFGTVSFLIFDRRTKLKPIFLSVSILLYYYLLYSVSTKLQISGIFTADRYIPGLVFGVSFFLAVLLAPISEMIIRNYILKVNKFLLTIIIVLSILGLGLLINEGFSRIQITQDNINQLYNKSQTYKINKGIGSLGRGGNNNTINSQVATGLSFATLVFFIFILIKFPKILKIKSTS